MGKQSVNWMFKSRETLEKYILQAIPNLDLSTIDLDHLTDWDSVKTFILKNLSKKAYQPPEHNFIFRTYDLNSISIKEEIKNYVLF